MPRPKQLGISLSDVTYCWKWDRPLGPWPSSSSYALFLYHLPYQRPILFHGSRVCSLTSDKIFVVPGARARRQTCVMRTRDRVPRRTWVESCGSQTGAGFSVQLCSLLTEQKTLALVFTDACIL